MPPKPTRKQWIGYLLIFGGALGFVLDGLLLSIINQKYSLPAEFLILFRLLAGTLVLLVILGVRRPASLKVKTNDLATLLLMGVLFEGVGGFAYTIAIFRIGVSISTVLAHTAPFWVTVFVVLTKQEKLSLPKIVALGGSFVGMILITQAYTPGPVERDSLGIAMGLVCGLVVAAFFLISHKAGSTYSPWTITIYSLIGGTLSLALFQHPNQWSGYLSAPGVILWLILLGLGPGFLAVVCWVAGVQYIPASVSSLVGGALEPLLAAGAAFVVLGERLHLIQMAGAGLIITSLLVLGAHDTSQNRVKSPIGREMLQERFDPRND